MNKFLLGFCIILVFISCNKEYYTYKGVKFVLYRDIEGAEPYSKIRAIDLSNKNLKELPAEISEMDSLVFLNLKNNKITGVNSSICELKNIKTLNLSNNPIVSFDSCFFLMSELENLSIADCNMVKMPRELVNLKSLNTLLIGGNNFTQEEINFLKQSLPNCKIIQSVD